MYQLVIKEYGTNKIDKEFEPVSNERIAERLERGVNINLNHDKYYTEIIEVKNAKS